jgi:hypothetical protein
VCSIEKLPGVVAVVAIHGVGSPDPGATARAMADTLASATGAFVSEERVLRLHGVLDLSAPTPLLAGTVGPSLRTHVFELYWADLSKSKPTIFSILGQLLRLAPRLLIIGRQGLRDARQESSRAVRLMSWLYEAMTFILGRALPLLNASVILAAGAASVSFLMPTAVQHLVLFAALAFLSIVVATWIAFKWFFSQSAPVLLGISLVLGAFIFSGVVAAAVLGWGSYWKSLLLACEVLFVITILFSIVAHFVADARPWRVALPLSFMSVLVIALVIYSSAGNTQLDFTALGEMTRWLLGLIAWSWLAMLVLAGGLWCLYWIMPSDLRAERAVWTAKWAFAISFAIAVLAQTFLLVLLRECDGLGFCSHFFPAASFAHFVFDALKLAWPLTTFVMLALFLVVAVWSTAPSLIAELQGQHSPAGEATGSRAAQLGLWLTSGRKALAATVALFSFLLVFAGPGVSVASYFIGPVQDLLAWSDDRFWAMALPASLAALTALLRSPSGMKHIWPVLGIVLDIDTYLRRDRGSRQKILDRGQLICQVLQNGASITGTRYSKIVFVAHSQGTLIAVDLLRTCKEQLGALKVPVALVTMGSPIRALYSALLPYEMKWFPDDADGTIAYAPGITHWRNLFLSGDYIGRSLWRKDDDQATYTDAYTNVRLSETCLGTGAHMQYWKNPLVGRQILDEIKSVSATSTPA